MPETYEVLCKPFSLFNFLVKWWKYEYFTDAWIGILELAIF